MSWLDDIIRGAQDVPQEETQENTPQTHENAPGGQEQQPEAQGKLGYCSAFYETFYRTKEAPEHK